jgi:DNA-binding Xre family transcriptional regulator
MFTNHPILDIFDYICAQNAQCWARITKSNMEIQRYNRLKIVLAEKERTGTWLSEQMGHSISTVSRWMTNKVQPSVEQLYEIARHLDVDVKELLVSSKEK